MTDFSFLMQKSLSKISADYFITNTVIYNFLIICLTQIDIFEKNRFFFSQMSNENIRNHNSIILFLFICCMFIIIFKVPKIFKI